MQKLRRVLLSEKRRVRVSLGLAAAVVAFLALRCSAWLRLRDVHPNLVVGSQAGLVFHFLAALTIYAVVVELIRTEIGPAIRALTATCVLLPCFCLVFQFWNLVTVWSLQIAGTIGAMTLLLRIRSGLFDRMLAWLALIVFGVHLWMIVSAGRLSDYLPVRHWIAQDWGRIYGTLITLLFLPTVAVLLMMLAGPDVDPEETGLSDAAETGAT